MCLTSECPGREPATITCDPASGPIPRDWLSNLLAILQRVLILLLLLIERPERPVMLVHHPRLRATPAIPGTSVRHR